MSQTTVVRQCALVTGASSGIGLELTRLLATNKHDLVLVARREEALNSVAAEARTLGATKVRVIAADLAEPTSPAHVADLLASEGVLIDLLINNAGFAGYGPFVETELNHELAMIQVNITALTEMTKRFVPAMVARGRGRVLNLASTAAFAPGPLMAVYYASKAYVLSLSEALAEELRGSGVTVTALCPGPTETGFQQRATMEDSRLVSGKEIGDAASVAKAGYDGMMAGKRIVVPGRRNWLDSELPRFMPRRVTPWIVKRMQESTCH